MDVIRQNGHNKQVVISLALRQLSLKELSYEQETLHDYVYDFLLHPVASNSHMALLGLEKTLR